MMYDQRMTAVGAEESILRHRGKPPRGGGGGGRTALILASSEVAVPKTTRAPMLVDSVAPMTPIVLFGAVAYVR